jgi:hypothetical protein
VAVVGVLVGHEPTVELGVVGMNVDRGVGQVRVVEIAVLTGSLFQA